MEKNISSQFVKYVAFNIAGMLGISFYIIADTFFISMALGSRGLAALNFTLAVFNIIYGFGQMVGIGGAARSSILKSIGKIKNFEKIFMNSLYIGMIAGLIFLLSGVFFTTEISYLLGADNETIAYTEVYICTLLCFAPCFILNYIITAYVRNDGNPKICMVAMLVSSIANIILDYIFIFTFSMGMYGAVFATGLSPIISLSVLCVHLAGKKTELKLIKCCISIKRIMSLLKLGVSAFITEFSSSVTVIAFNFILLETSGNTGVAAYGIIANSALVASSIFSGVSQGVQPLASRYCKENSQILRKIAAYTAITVILISVGIYLTVFFGAENIIAVFNSENNERLGRIAVKGIKIYFLGYLIAGMNIVSSAFFSAIDMAAKSAVISVLRSALLIVPSVIILGMLLKINGVWLSFTVTELITGIVSVKFIVSSGVHSWKVKGKSGKP